ncbi:MAG: alpha/beta hydrolase [Clostridia bacterium]|nr:alpha/beta hydrolase [Clostridia bacterium]
MDIPKSSKCTDLIYKKTNAKDLMLTFLPPIVEKYEKAPIYFIIPGGGWHVGERQSMIDFSAESVNMLRNNGFAVVSIDYRLCGDRAVMREIIGDCFDALTYIAHFADVLKIDRERIALSGHSAGAHLALMLAYAPREIFASGCEFDDRFAVKAVAVMSAPTILYDTDTHALRDLDEVFIGCNTKEEKSKTSPISYATDTCPPTLLCAGTGDYLVFGTSSERMYEALKQCNVDCELILSENGGHCFEKIYKELEPSVSMTDIQRYIEEFIIKYV